MGIPLAMFAYLAPATLLRPAAATVASSGTYLLRAADEAIHGLGVE